MFKYHNINIINIKNINLNINLYIINILKSRFKEFEKKLSFLL